MPATATAPCPHGYHHRPLCPVCGSAGVTADVQGVTLPQPPAGAATAASALTAPWTGATPGAPIAVPGYEILKELGRGGMGVVYKARQMAVGRVVALKMILSGELAAPRERERFRAEAEAVARLQHPNIVQLYEYGEAAGRPYFSLEFVGGGSLADRLDGTPRPADHSAELVETLARAMHYAHQQGVIHRDLKPANLFLCGREPARMVKVLDFGISKVFADEEVSQTTTPSLALGTPHYMSPEQILASKDVDARSDIWSLGIILYKAIAGCFPFEGDSATALVVAIATKKPSPLEDHAEVAPELARATMKALEKELSARWSRVEDFARAIEPFGTGRVKFAPVVAISGHTGGRPLSAAEEHAETVVERSSPGDVFPTEGNWTQNPRASKRGPWRIGAAVAVACALVAVGLFGLVRLRAQPAPPPKVGLSVAPESPPPEAPPVLSVVPMPTPALADSAASSAASPPAAAERKPPRASPPGRRQPPPPPPPSPVPNAPASPKDPLHL
jgi:serine/threonine protein kinase